MLEWLALLMEHWPTAGLIATLLIGVYLVARYLSAVEVRDMRARIDYLDDRVRAMRFRDECYFDYIVYTQEFQNRQALIASARGHELEKHVPFLLFRERWMSDRGLEDEQEEMWK
ncbi:hypothetical protein JRC04_04730 [Mycolicibacterium sp. S2-37]|uniref:hypothetical protein n=1 Tax=Mycolicibacterium sp. S2-37 TaxID=2810297 RepID=UPI001A93F4ED|nr:hypothetical protein [Mycolicibacterium sp. S2-37]MBO0676764.1 hypothetical protein [Mycolicibacterium sp. S2-37]